MQSYRAASILTLLCLAACGPKDFLLGAGTMLGMGAMQERGVGGGISDYETKLAINEKWFRTSLELYQRADLMISQGRVLLTGRVADEVTKLQAGALAYEAGAKEVINRLTIGPDLSFEQGMKDRATALRLQADLTFDRDVAALNYDVAVSDGIVYLLGIARDEGEVRRVTYLASALSGVRGVESFMVLSGEKP
jgi:osmotically-inducible protein OsmY